MGPPAPSTEAAARLVLPKRMLRRFNTGSAVLSRRVLSLILVLPSTDNAAKADMAGRGVDRVCVPRRRAVAPAVIRRAQMRAALQHLARNRNVGLARVVACFPVAALRVLRDAAGLVRIGPMSRR